MVLHVVYIGNLARFRWACNKAKGTLQEHAHKVLYGIKSTYVQYHEYVHNPDRIGAYEVLLRTHTEKKKRRALWDRMADVIIHLVPFSQSTTL